jgi:hypothetical protein
MSSSEADYGKTKMNFEKPREVFLHNGLKNKNLSIFFTGATSWENRSHLRAPFFHFFIFPVTVLILRELFRRLEANLENQWRFLSITCSYKITSFSFFPGVIIEEKHMSEWTPIFCRNSACLSWQTVPDF